MPNKTNLKEMLVNAIVEAVIPVVNYHEEMNCDECPVQQACLNKNGPKTLSFAQCCDEIRKFISENDFLLEKALKALVVDAQRGRVLTMFNVDKVTVGQNWGWSSNILPPNRQEKQINVPKIFISMRWLADAMVEDVKKTIEKVAARLETDAAK